MGQDQRAIRVSFWEASVLGLQTVPCQCVLWPFLYGWGWGIFCWFGFGGGWGRESTCSQVHSGTSSYKDIILVELQPQP